MWFSLLTAAAALTSLSLGTAVPSPSSHFGFINSTTGPSRGGKSICISGTLSVAATASNMQINFVALNQTIITQSLVSSITNATDFMEQISGPMHNVSGVYDIYAHLCMPKNGQKSKIVQFLTHGVGFDSSYWDFAPGYSYVDVATTQGYMTFSYDRLGQGQSSKPDPIQVIQAPTEVVIAENLISMLRQGIANQSFSTVVGVGHSYGSVLTQAVTAQESKAFDATILTGYSTNRTGDGYFKLGNDFSIASHLAPKRFANLLNGYVASSNPQSLQTAFYYFPGFDPAILEASYEQEGTVALGEFFTQQLVARPASNYTGPVAIVNGLQDLPFCFGNCLSPLNKGLATLNMMYPAAKVKKTYYAQNTGHGLNLHYNAINAYAFIMQFLKTNGLGA